MTISTTLISRISKHESIKEILANNNIEAQSLAPQMAYYILKLNDEKYSYVQNLSDLIEYFDINAPQAAFENKTLLETILDENISLWSLSFFADKNMDFSQIKGRCVLDFISCKIHDYSQLVSQIKVLEPILESRYPGTKLSSYAFYKIFRFVIDNKEKIEMVTSLIDFEPELYVDVHGRTLLHYVAQSDISNTANYQKIRHKITLIDSPGLLNEKPTGIALSKPWIIHLDGLSFQQHITALQTVKLNDFLTALYDYNPCYADFLDATESQFLNTSYSWGQSAEVEKHFRTLFGSKIERKLLDILAMPDLNNQAFIEHCVQKGVKYLDLLKTEATYYKFIIIEFTNSLTPEIKDKVKEFFAEKTKPKQEKEGKKAEEKSEQKENAVEATCELYTDNSYNQFTAYLKDNDNEVAQKLLKGVMKHHGFRTKKISKSSILMGKISYLYEKFPHFEEVTRHIENNLQLQSRGDDEFFIPPILMTGGAGIGKTFYSHQLADLALTHFASIGMESVTASFVLNGSSSQWGGAAPGFIFNTLKNSAQINPIILLDEIDKTAGSSNYPPINTLLPLLERYTAKNYQDECVLLSVDASRINWIATANDISSLSGPIKSRFDLFHVANPNLEQKKALIQGVYETILKSNTWGHHMSGAISQEVLAALAQMGDAARDLRRMITTACSRAVVDSQREIHIKHLDSYKPLERMPWEM